MKHPRSSKPFRTMAKEKETLETPSEKKYRVTLSRNFKKPQHKQLPAGGVIYMRGGYKFYDKDGEGFSYHIVDGRELEKFKVVKHRVFDSDSIEWIVDPNLYAEEIKG